MNDYRRLLLVRRAMRRRCYDPNDQYYYLYGAQGVTICNDWLQHPSHFVRWALTNGYRQGLYLDRKNNTKPYAPSNCRWVTPTESTRNRRNTRRAKYEGKLRAIAEIAELEDIPFSLIDSRWVSGKRGAALWAPKAL